MVRGLSSIVAGFPLPFVTNTLNEVLVEVTNVQMTYLRRHDIQMSNSSKNIKHILSLTETYFKSGWITHVAVYDLKQLPYSIFFCLGNRTSLVMCRCDTLILFFKRLSSVCPIAHGYNVMLHSYTKHYSTLAIRLKKKRKKCRLGDQNNRVKVQQVHFVYSAH